MDVALKIQTVFPYMHVTVKYAKKSKLFRRFSVPSLQMLELAELL